MTHEAASSDLVFSPNGAGSAYVARSGKQDVVVKDGTVLREHDEAFGPIFSPDGRRFAYVAREGSRMFVILDGKMQPEYEGIEPSSLVFSPDSRRFAYSAAVAGKNLVVIDGNETEPYDATFTGPGCPAFSPDSQRVAFAARDGSRWVRSRATIWPLELHQQSTYPRQCIKV